MRDTLVASDEMSSFAVSQGQMGFAPSGLKPGDTVTLSTIRGVQPTVCQIKVIDALNRRFPAARITAANIASDANDSAKLAVANVNIRGTEKQLATVGKGRYLARRHMFLELLIGYGPSLHIVSRPSFLDPHALRFSRTAFTAHLDSAWADTPVGAFLHFVLDVLRPKSRNPCPG